MIKVENIETFGWEAALRGMRNAKESWAKSDTYYSEEDDYLKIGPNDYKLAMELVHAGTPHCKFRRMIFVTMDITAPAYFWKDFDTYKVGTTANSTSSYDILRKRGIKWSDFSADTLDGRSESVLVDMIRAINQVRDEMIGKHGKLDRLDYAELSALIPMSFNYTRTWAANYEVLATIYKQRKDHRLNEFRELCHIFEYNFPYPEFIIGHIPSFTEMEA